MARITRTYERSLRFVLAYPLVFGIACIALIAGSFFCFEALGSDLLPEMDEGVCAWTDPVLTGSVLWPGLLGSIIASPRPWHRGAGTHVWVLPRFAPQEIRR